MPAMPALDGVRHDYVDAGGLRMHVAEMGPAGADPLLLIHGWPQNWWEWRAVMPALAGDHRVLAPDLRGLGWTDAPPDGYLKEEMALDLVRLLDAVEIESAHVVGHDWGGWIGCLLALLHTERVRSLIALSILPPLLPRSPRAVLSLGRLAYQWVLASPAGARICRSMAEPGSRLGRRVGSREWSALERETFMGQFRDPARARASVRYYRDFQLRELPRMAAGRYAGLRFEVPTRLVMGTRELVQDHHLLDGVERFGDDLSAEIVEGAGHFVVDERPELVIDRIRELARRAPRPRANGGTVRRHGTG